MKKLLLFAAIILLLSTLASAYPISPRPLRKLVIESEFIIQGKVIKLGTEKRSSKKYDWDSDYALILVQEVLKGHLKKDTLKVYYSSGMICPAPPRYILGEVAIIFLDKVKEKKNEWFATHALSYGVKYFLTEEGFSVYKKRITEMQEILKMDEGKERDVLTLEWIVTCAVNKHTRWDGVYELSPGSNFMSHYDRTGPSTMESFLSTDQRKRIFEAFLNTDSLTYTDMGLADIVAGMDDKKLLEHLKKGLANQREDYLWPAQAIMERIVLLTGDFELERLSEEFEKTIYSYKDEEVQKTQTIYKEFLKQAKNVGLKKVIYASGESST